MLANNQPSKSAIWKMDDLASAKQFERMQIKKATQNAQKSPML